MKQKKETITLNIPQEIISKIRDIVYWTPGVTISGLVQTYFLNLIDSMEKDRGEPFPRRANNLRSGRPLKPIDILFKE